MDPTMDPMMLAAILQGANGGAPAPGAPAAPAGGMGGGGDTGNQQLNPAMNMSPDAMAALSALMQNYSNQNGQQQSASLGNGMLGQMPPGMSWANMPGM